MERDGTEVLRLEDLYRVELRERTREEQPKSVTPFGPPLVSILLSVVSFKRRIDKKKGKIF